MGNTLSRCLLWMMLCVASAGSMASDGIYLQCRNDLLGMESTVSVYRESNRIVFQEDSVVMKDGVPDAWGGIASIRVTNPQIHVSYSRPNGYQTITTINRVTGQMTVTDNNSKSYQWNCRSTTRKF